TQDAIVRLVVHLVRHEPEDRLHVIVQAGGDVGGGFPCLDGAGRPWRGRRRSADLAGTCRTEGRCRTGSREDTAGRGDEPSATQRRTPSITRAVHVALPSLAR